jgi:hypothetical protein
VIGRMFGMVVLTARWLEWLYDRPEDWVVCDWPEEWDGCMIGQRLGWLWLSHHDCVISLWLGWRCDLPTGWNRCVMTVTLYHWSDGRDGCVI